LGIFFFVFFCVFTTSCNRKAHEFTKVEKSNEVVKIEPEKKTQLDTGVYVVLKLERTACYGNCPAYTALLRSDGIAEFCGSGNVELMGNYRATAGQQEILEIMAKLKQVDFFQFAEHYPLNRNYVIPDLPYTYTTVNNGSKMKRIADNYDSPENLQWFEKELDAFFKQLNWTKIKD